jgi:[ribosomal protein S18]-alanine N-acetyltransferase
MTQQTSPILDTGRTEQDQLRVHIRWMLRRNLPEVLETEQRSFEFAWTEEDFLRCLRQRNCIGMVAEQDEKVVGFMIYELHKAKVHILDFAVNPSCRRRGVGSQMVQKVISKWLSPRRTRIILKVRETNLTAQLFFSKQSFKAVRVLRGYYEDSGEDAFLMRFRFADATGEDQKELVSPIALYDETQ